MRRFLAWLTQPRETEYERGRRTAAEFLATYPPQAAIDQYWSSACVDEAFSSDGFAKGTKEVLRAQGAHA